MGISSLGAALFASLAFGLWHIFLTILGIRINDPQASGHKLRAAVAGAVLLTTAAGLGLTWLRLRTGGLIAPIVLHGGINSVSATGGSQGRSSLMLPTKATRFIGGVDLKAP